MCSGVALCYGGKSLLASGVGSGLKNAHHVIQRKKCPQCDSEKRNAHHVIRRKECPPCDSERNAKCGVVLGTGLGSHVRVTDRSGNI